MKCFRCGAPLKVRVAGAQIIISKHEKLDGLTINMKEVFQLESGTDEPIRIVCSKDSTHKQIGSTESKLKFTIATLLAVTFRSLAQKYVC